MFRYTVQFLFDHNIGFICNMRGFCRVKDTIYIFKRINYISQFMSNFVHPIIDLKVDQFTFSKPYFTVTFFRRFFHPKYVKLNLQAENSRWHLGPSPAK